MRTSAILLFLLLAACSANEPGGSQAKADSVAKVAYKKLDLAYNKPVVVGAGVHVSAVELPAGKTVELQWGTVTGGWLVEDYYHFKGKKYTETASSLGKFDIDSSGHLDARFTVPEDYGGVHEVTALYDGKPIAQNGIEVTQSFEMTPMSGPVGTPIELRVKGLGWRTMESTWVVNWDNHAVGFVSAAGTRGSAVARFRAAGPAGDHPVKVYSGYQGQSYLNYEQAPNAYLPRPEFTFRTTAGRVAAPASYIEPYPAQPVPKIELHVANANLDVSPTQGPVGTRVMLRGDGFGTARAFQLVWQTFAGSRVSGNGFESQERAIGEVKVGSNGRIESAMTIPDDVGGLHGLALREGDKPVALAHFVVETSIVSMSPASGPVGTPITIHLKGVGWTEYDNIYVATYDNAYMGYACGFNSHGDVVINFTASGPPGEHLIDLFPGIYQGPSTEPQLLYRQPQLTYAEDHPGNKIPALHFKFEVTSGSTQTSVNTQRPAILAIGDSMTAGYGVAADSSYPAQLERELKNRGYDYRVVNQGVTGSTTTQALSRLNRGLAIQPEIVIIQLGGNDASQGIPREVSRENLRTIIQRFKPGGARIFFAGGRFPYLDDLAKEQNIPVIPFLEGVREHRELLLSDGAHPTGEGYTIVVQNILKVLEPAIRKSTAGR